MSEAQDILSIARGEEPDTIEVFGVEISTSDVEALAEMMDRINHEIDDLYAAQKVIRTAVGELAAKQQRTERVLGEGGSVMRVEWPEPSLDQAKLRKAYESGYGKSLLAIERLRVDKRAWKKALGTSGPEDFEKVKTLIGSAFKPSERPPAVKIEKLRGAEYGS